MAEVKYDCGFLVVTRDPRRDDAPEIEQLGERMKDVFGLAVGRARGARGGDFLGQQIYIPSLQVVGRLADVSPAGIVTVSYRWNLNPERISNENYSGPGDDLLVIVSGEGPDGASPDFLLLDRRRKSLPRVRARRGGRPECRA